jgi:hypothetical protein
MALSVDWLSGLEKRMPERLPMKRQLEADVLEHANVRIINQF